MSRKKHRTGTLTFWFRRFSHVSPVTFNEAYNCSHMLSVSIHLLSRFNRFTASRITALSPELQTSPLPETHVRAELSQMDGIVQRSVLFKYDLDSLNADFLSHLHITSCLPDVAQSFAQCGEAQVRYSERRG